MNTANEDSLRKCLESAQKVMLAGQQLHSLLDDDLETRGWAAQDLEKAAQDYDDTRETECRRFIMTPETNREIKDFEQTQESLLVVALTDLQIGNVMIAAGGAIKEVEIPDERSILNDALLNLETTTQFFKQTLSGSASSTLDQGENKELLSVKTFKNSLQETLDSFVCEAEKAVSGVCEGLSKVDPETVLSSISHLGKAIQDLPRMGRLFGQGVRKLEQGLEFLNQILPKEILEQLQEKVRELWEKVTQGELIHQILNNTFGIESVQSQVFEILETAVDSNSLNTSKLDQVNPALIALSESFKGKMKIAQNITGAVTATGLILPYTPLAGAPAMILVTSIYIAVIAVVIIVGRDYTDADDIGCVPGVITVTKRLL